MGNKFLNMPVLAALVSLATIHVHAADLSLPTAPLFVAEQNNTSLVMLVMGRDHTLYYEAYNDASDVDGDKKPDTRFKPSIEYYGYFDSKKCYTANAERTLFTPVGATGSNYKCGSMRWSGNFLNYLTMSRMDALRKVLYGGSRKDDSDAVNPVLTRAFIPQDAHSWGKAWDPKIMNAANDDKPANNNLNISDYGPFPASDDGKFGYFFANTSLGDDQPPLLRVFKIPAENLGGATPSTPVLAYQHKFNSLYYRGTANNWSASPMTLVSNNKWKIKLRLKNPDKDNKNIMKFTVNADWSEAYGDNNNDGVAAIWESDIIFDAADDIYEISFNDKTLKYTIEKSTGPTTFASAPLYIWNWLSKERPVAGDSMDNLWVRLSDTGNLTDYQVNVRVCVAGLLETNCRKYGDNYLPIGLLQSFGEDSETKMEFGLISGSYKNNLQGGVLRANIDKIQKEVNEKTGLFSTRATGGGIIDTLDKLKATKFNFGEQKYDTDCGWITSGVLTNGKCSSWGNPIGEMLFESLRYFSGIKKASPMFTVGSDDELGLREEVWVDPFTATGRKRCDKPVNLVISDVNNSFDTDQMPGSAFVAYSDSSLGTFNAKTSTEIISNNEPVNDKTFFIGDNNKTDGQNTPTAKKIKDLANVRGLSPQEPTKQGGFYVAGAAYYGYQNDLNPNVSGVQSARTLAVALASPLPEISIAGGKVKLIPYAKSVGSDNEADYPISAEHNKYQPTNTIVDYYIESWTPTKGVFRINYEDVEQGADHDMDMIVRYEYEYFPATNKVKVKLTSEYAAGGIDQHAGYVISGTTKDGLYLDVKDKGGAAVAYYLDTVGDEPRGSNSSDQRDLPLEKERTFDISSGATVAGILNPPLWYAAKWGSFDDGLNETRPKDGIPQKDEWDSNEDDQPDNYFLVTNPLNLEESLRGALEHSGKDPRSGSNMSFTSSQITNGSFLFDSGFEAQYWSGDVVAYSMVNGKSSTSPAWKAKTQLDKMSPANRVIFTMENDSKAGSKRVFSAPTSVNALESGEAAALSKAQIDSLLTDFPPSLLSLDSSLLPAAKLKYLQLIVNYLRGDRTNEVKKTLDPLLNGKIFRERNGIIGDIVHSTPVYGVSSGDKQPFVIFGANDGMVHVLNATTGDELLAYVPSSSYKNLYRLSRESYNINHRFFVDGEIKIVNVTEGLSTRTIAVGTFGLGAQGAWALDLTNIKGLAATQTDANKILLWELNDSDSNSANRVGYMMRAPAVMSVSDKWYAIFGNGYNSSEADGASDALGVGSLLVVDLLNGDIVKTLLTKKGMAEDPMTALKRPNALTEPVIADKDLDGVGDTLYSGDLFGNVWKVDIANKAVSDWEFYSGSGVSPKPLFSAVSREGSSQPITQRPSVAYHPVEGLLVMVGTGKYIETTDVEVDNQPTQTLYGLWDKPGRTADITRSTLLEQTITQEIAATKDTKGQRETSKNLIDWTLHDGWYLDLYYGGKNSGERMNSRVVVRNSTAAFTTLIPSKDVCDAGGSGWYMEVGIYTGSNSYVDNNNADNNLVDHSALLDKIPSEPVITFFTNGNGDKEVINRVKINGGTPYESPGTTVNTGAISWQMLY